MAAPWPTVTACCRPWLRWYSQTPRMAPPHTHIHSTQFPKLMIGIVDSSAIIPPLIPTLLTSELVFMLQFSSYANSACWNALDAEWHASTVPQMPAPASAHPFHFSGL